MGSDGGRLHLFGTAHWRHAARIELPDNLGGTQDSRAVR